MKDPFTFIRKKDGQKPDANISMNIHGAFSTGGYGNAKIGGRDKMTYFLIFFPLIAFFILAVWPESEPEEVFKTAKIKNPIYVNGRIDKIYKFSTGHKAQFTYKYKGKEYICINFLDRTKSKNINAGDSVKIAIDKNNPEVSYPIRRIDDNLH